ncbi:hypothetical protein GGI03_000894 [Coemansia sp. RSA 2337]|nr:hypothetical protein GGI08_001885 [Coemansia sp. S2]KAJ2468597.1 hypothetical protein GGI03_000894 [Coemansia sp. RSA 2337]
MSGSESVTSATVTILQRSNQPSPTGTSSADQIVLDALCKSTDRAFLLDVEQQILDFVDNTRLPRLSYPKQNSYRRLLLHKLADYYSLSHVVAGRYRDEIVFYRKQGESDSLPELLATVVPPECVVADDNDCDAENRSNDDIVASPAAPGFTKILVKKRSPNGSADLKKTSGNSAQPVDSVVAACRVNSSPVVEESTAHLTGVDACCDKLAAVGIAGRTKTIEQRQAEYERARAEIFQDESSEEQPAVSGSSSPVSVAVQQHL